MFSFSEAKRHLYVLVITLFTLLVLMLPDVAAAAPTCSSAVKESVARAVDNASKLGAAEQLRVEAQQYQTYSYCAADGAQIPTTDPFYTAARQCGASVSYIGSTYFEEMSCCGYDPQRRTFACPVRIKQGGGFGPSPLPGSREYVLNCVQDAAGVYQPAAVDSVHLSNSVLLPSWQFAVVANANNNLQLLQPMNGVQRNARSILSWALQPTSCTYRPIWGNVVNYKIRLDQ